ncbi:serine protease 1-like [Podarcis raffonei]|uniref:serine protease 1-like n=1 Tax=Podarcis raffonei TaxID=65483 RepID=UPI0023292744|nr:serine protease 1-like [Podarcis raffonei]
MNMFLINSTWKSYPKVDVGLCPTVSALARHLRMPAAAAYAVAAAEKLVGSAKYQQDSVPWQVSLQSVHHVCSGALISQEWVLSSAQCSRSSPDHMEVWLGLQVPETPPKEKQQVIAAAKLVPHKQFNNYTLDYDIMLIKLAQPAVLGELVQPISLPSQCAIAGTQCLASEWISSNSDGTDNLLQCSYLPVTSDATCNNVYPGRFTDRMLCAGQLDSSQDACKVRLFSFYWQVQ